MEQTRRKRWPALSAGAGTRGILLCLLMCACSMSLSAQGVVKGLVTNQQDEPLPGAAVTVKGTYTGVTTGVDGRFSIAAARGAVLVVTSMGYETVEVTVGSGDVVVKLKDSFIELEEVVAIGYGSMRRGDLTGSSTPISAEQIEKKMATSVLEAIQGQVAGVQIISGSGQPGEAATVQIRGTSTFSAEGVKPLYIVDGAPMDDIDGLNPNDIASMEILKDAASAAIYGSRSANGVFIITTKQGEQGKPRVELKYNHSWGQLTHKLPQANRQQRLDYDNIRKDYLDTYSVGGNPLESIQMIQDTLNVFFNVDNDYQNIVFQTSKRDEVNLSISGAENKLKYYATTGLYNENGIISNTGFKRLNARVNADYSPNKVLTMKSRLSLTYSRKSGIDEGTLLNAMLTRRPYFSMWYPDGTLVGVFNGQKNPIAQTEYTTNFTDNYRATFFQSFELNLLPGLKWQTNLNVFFNQSKRFQSIPSFITDEWQKSNSAMSDNYMNWNWLNENFLNYSKKWKSGHELTAMAGFSAQEWRTNRELLSGINSSTDYIYTLNAFAAGLDLTSTGTWESANTMASLFGRVTYNYKSRYLLAANFRRDGSSRFAKNNKWGNFPSVSAGWRFSDESFMTWASHVLHDAKVRVSWGVTGNESIGNYDYIYSYSPGTIYDGVGGVGATRIGVDNLKWEQTEQIDAGLDVALFKGRLQLTFDYYNKRTTGLLANYQLPKESGHSYMRTNVGEISNKGFEVAVSGDILRLRDWTWNAAFNMTMNKNRIKKLSEGTAYMVGDLWWMEEGGKIGDFYGYQSHGIFQYDESNAFTSDWQQLTPVFSNGTFQKYTLNGADYNGTVKQKTLPNGKPFRGGDYNWEDVDGDGVIDDNDRKVIGNALPRIYGGVSTTVSYKNLALAVSFYYSLGGDVYNNVAHQRNRFQYTGTTPAPEVIYNIWTKPGDNAIYPRPYNDEYNNGRYANSFYVEDGSFIRLQNVRLTYDLPKRYLNKVFVKGIGVYAYVNNALTWTNYTGYDPEFSTSDPLQVGKDTNRYPRKREFGLGININF